MSSDTQGRFDGILIKYRLFPLKDIIFFILLILIFSGAGYLWKHVFDYRIFGVKVLEPAYAFLIKYIVLSSYWMLSNIFSIPLTYEISTSRLYFSDSSYLFVYHGCSGLKEMAMFAFVMMIFPGPWKHKSWFIPTSLCLIYFISILRIVSLSLIYLSRPDWFNFFHEYIFNIIFFAVFFLLWVAWVKYFYKKKNPASSPG